VDVAIGAGEAMTVERLTAWVASRAATTDPIVRAELSHLAAEAAAMLASYDVGSDPGAIVAEAWTDSHAHAANYRGLQRYALRIYRATNPRRSAGQFVWLLDGEQEQADSHGAVSEPATDKGLSEKLMRHLEARERMQAGVLAKTYEILVDDSEKKAARIQQLEAERLRTWEAAESLIDQRHLRELDFKRLERGELRKDQALQSLQLLIPTIAGKLGQKLLGLPANAGGPAGTEMAQLSALLNSFTEGQFNGLIGMLDTTQRITLLDLIKKLSPPEPTNPPALSDGQQAPQANH
jgi:hypothetical protein